MKSICETDGRRVLEFVARASAAIIASGWQTPALGILDMYENNAANAERRAERPALATLADEYFGPFESELMPVVERDSFANLREAVAATFGADTDGNRAFYFRTFAHDETANWELQDTPLAGVPAFGLYMVREDDRTGYGKFLSNVFCYRDPDDGPKNEYGQGPCEAYLDGPGSDLEHENGGNDGWEGLTFARSAEADKLDSDPRYSQRYDFDGCLFEIDLRKVDAAELQRAMFYSDAIDSVVAEMAEVAAESAFEYFNGNACHPRAILAA